MATVPNAPFRAQVRVMTCRNAEEGGVLRRETRSGAFRRAFTLPEHVTGDDIEAGYDRGLLTIRVRGVSKPKVEPRKIEIRRQITE